MRANRRPRRARRPVVTRCVPADLVVRRRLLLLDPHQALGSGPVTRVVPAVRGHAAAFRRRRHPAKSIKKHHPDYRRQFISPTPLTTFYLSS